MYNLLLLCTVTSFNFFLSLYMVYINLYFKGEEIKTWGYKPKLVHFST